MLVGLLEFLFGSCMASLAAMTLVKRTVPTVRAMRLGARAEGVIILSSTVGSEAWNSRDLKSRPH